VDGPGPVNCTIVSICNESKDISKTFNKIKTKKNKEQNRTKHSRNKHENRNHIPTNQALKNVSTGIDFLLNHCSQQLPISDGPEDIDEHEFWQWRCLGMGIILYGLCACI
jgi:hypothetical protein